MELDFRSAKLTITSGADADFTIGLSMEFPNSYKAWLGLTMAECEELEDALRKARTQARMADARAQVTA